MKGARGFSSGVLEGMTMELSDVILNEVGGELGGALKTSEVILDAVVQVCGVEDPIDGLGGAVVGE
jgi:hypothetical protein